MVSTQRLTCVLFDLDGTLVDTTDLIFESYRYTLQTLLGFTPTDEELLGQYGRPLPETMRELLLAPSRTAALKLEDATTTDDPKGNLKQRAGRTQVADEELVDNLVRFYRDYNVRNHDGLIRPFPYVDETLAELRRRGYMLGVVTSKGRPTVHLTMGRYGIDRYIKTLVTEDDVVQHKPHPEPVLRALAEIQVAPEQALFVGDSVFDIMAGQAAGTKTGAALWGPFPREELASLRPDYMLESMRDLLKVCPPLNP
jgi:pyrophosphatase PpaX